MNDSQIGDLPSRMAKLEAELARVKLERDLYKASTYDLLREQEFGAPLTLQEQDELMNAPAGESIESILEQFELRHPEL